MFTLGSAKPVEKTLIPATGDRPAVTVTFQPQPSPLSLRAARKAVTDVFREHGTEAIEAAGDAFTAALIRHNILGWSGIGDERGEPVLPTQDVEHRDADGKLLRVDFGTISAFLAEPRLVEAADREYVMPWALLDAEKNGFAPGPNGTGPGETPAGDIATTSASTEPLDDAGTTTGRRPARTTGSNRKRTRAKRSGK